MLTTEAKPKRKKVNVWRDFGEQIQIYDVLFEVDKLNSIRLTRGKDSSEYKAQHDKAIRMVDKYNTETYAGSLSLSKCRSIIQGPRHEEGVVFFNDGKKVASNRENF